MPGEHAFHALTAGGLGLGGGTQQGRVAVQRKGRLGSGEESPLFLQLFLKNLDEVAPTVWMFGQMVQTQHVRVWPRVPHSDTNHSTSPWVELLGCEPGTGGAGSGIGGSGKRDGQEPSALPSHQCPRWWRPCAQGLGTAVPVVSVPQGEARAMA